MNRIHHLCIASCLTGAALSLCCAGSQVMAMPTMPPAPDFQSNRSSSLEFLMGLKSADSSIVTSPHGFPYRITDLGLADAPINRDSIIDVSYRVTLINDADSINWENQHQKASELPECLADILSSMHRGSRGSVWDMDYIKSGPNQGICARIDYQFLQADERSDWAIEASGVTSAQQIDSLYKPLLIDYLQLFSSSFEDYMRDYTIGNSRTVLNARDLLPDNLEASASIALQQPSQAIENQLSNLVRSYMKRHYIMDYYRMTHDLMRRTPITLLKYKEFLNHLSDPDYEPTFNTVIATINDAQEQESMGERMAMKMLQYAHNSLSSVKDPVIASFRRLLPFVPRPSADSLLASYTLCLQQTIETDSDNVYARRFLDEQWDNELTFALTDVISRQFKVDELDNCIASLSDTAYINTRLRLSTLPVLPDSMSVVRLQAKKTLVVPDDYRRAFDRFFSLVSPDIAPYRALQSEGRRQQYKQMHLSLFRTMRISIADMNRVADVLDSPTYQAVRSLVNSCYDVNRMPLFQFICRSRFLEWYTFQNFNDKMDKKKISRASETLRKRKVQDEQH